LRPEIPLSDCRQCIVIAATTLQHPYLIRSSSILLLFLYRHVLYLRSGLLDGHLDLLADLLSVPLDSFSLLLDLLDSLDCLDLYQVLNDHCQEKLQHVVVAHDHNDAEVETHEDRTVTVRNLIHS
jgi:hypothetical protein